MVHKDAPNHFRRYSKKVRPAIPSRLLLAAQSEIDLMHQRRALQGLSASLLLKEVVGQAPEVVIYQGHQRVQCRLVTLTPSLEQFRHLAVTQLHRQVVGAILYPIHICRRTILPLAVPAQ
jgi:hypothetical protein